MNTRNIRPLKALLLAIAMWRVTAHAAPAWQEGSTYTAGTVVSYGGHDYQALVTHTAYVGAGWNPASTPTLWKDLGVTTGTTPTATPTPAPTVTPTPAVTATPKPTITPLPSTPPTATPSPPPATPTVTPTPATGASRTAAAWSAGTAYNGGTQVSYNGRNYTAKWWTQGNVPSSSTGEGQPWASNGPCSGGNPSPTPVVTATPTPVTPTATPVPGPTPTPAPVSGYRFASVYRRERQCGLAPAGRKQPAAALSRWPSSTRQAVAMAAGRRSESNLISQAASLKALGGGVIISSGGWNASDIVRTCTDARSIATVYENVLERFGADHLDSDPEHGDQEQSGSGPLLIAAMAALKILQDRFKAKGKTAYVSFTLGVIRSAGFDVKTSTCLQSGQGPRCGCERSVNPMITDYYDGVSGNQMGRRFGIGLQGVFSQIKNLWAGQDRCTVLGHAVGHRMIGQNDNPTEVFTLNDAAIVR
nr:chitinase [Aeromonas sp. 10S-24]prf//2206304B chitinase [Aeromonas sp.]